MGSRTVIVLVALVCALLVSGAPIVRAKPAWAARRVPRPREA